MTFTAILQLQPDGGYSATCPALPGLNTEGDSLEETLRNLEEAVELYIESLRAHGESLPVENILIKPLTVQVA